MIKETVVFIGGTWSGHLEEDELHWWQYWEPQTFSKAFRGFTRRKAYAFQWSGDLKACRWRWNKPWKKAALRLIHELQEAGITRPIIVAHSHGGNVALEAIGMGLKVDRLVTLATPPRAGVPTFKGNWVNVVGTKDWTVRFGMLMDGRVSTKTTHKDAQNIVLPGESHGSVHELATWRKHKVWIKLMDAWKGNK